MLNFDERPELFEKTFPYKPWLSHTTHSSWMELEYRVQRRKSRHSARNSITCLLRDHFGHFIPAFVLKAQKHEDIETERGFTRAIDFYFHGFSLLLSLTCDFTAATCWEKLFLWTKCNLVRLAIRQGFSIQNNKTRITYHCHSNVFRPECQTSTLGSGGHPKRLLFCACSACSSPLQSFQ